MEGAQNSEDEPDFVDGHLAGKLKKSLPICVQNTTSRSGTGLMIEAKGRSRMPLELTLYGSRRRWYQNKALVK
jgi:hypothetical protein